MSLSLNGNGAYAEVPKTGSLKSLTTFTAEAWLKTNSTANQQGIIERYNWLAQDDGGFVLRLIPGGKLLFGTVRNANEYEFVTGVTSLTAGDWQHVAGVFDGHQLRVYVDGNLDGSKDSNLYPAQGTASLKIGARGDDASNTFDGLIDDAKLSQGVVYKGSFKPEKYLIAGGTSDPAAPTTTWGVWTFDDKQTIDFSGAKNDLELKEDASFSEDVNDYTYSIGNAPNTTPVQINFDDLSSGTIINSLYTQNYKISFSSTNNYFVYGYFGGYSAYVQTQPNLVVRGVLPFFLNHSAPLTITFTEPVNDLKFYVLSSDDFGVIAKYDIYQNGIYVTTRDVIGTGGSHPPPQGSYAPIPIDLAAVPNVTRVVVYNITDSYGLVFDSFSYTYGTGPTPTPTPVSTPAPTPPPAPNSLGATGDEEAVSLRWNPPSAGITSYLVKRAIGNTANAPANFVVVATVPANTTTYMDTGLMPEQTYTYVISATNNVGESPNSTPAAGTTLPKVGCRGTTYTRPADVNYTFGPWKALASISDNDGLVLRDIYLNNRVLADRISLPYFKIDAYKDGSQAVQTRGELKPITSGTNMRSRLTGIFLKNTGPDYFIGANYEIDGIPGVPNACLNIKQEYHFYDPRADSQPLTDGRCEPSGDITNCARFNPLVKYEFKGGNGEHLRSITTPERATFFINQKVGGVSVLRDLDSLSVSAVSSGGFKLPKENPVEKEGFYQVVKQGRIDAGKVDNAHFSDVGDVSEPPIVINASSIPHIGAGCPNCVHLHWRWGEFLKFPPGHGGQLLNNNSDQTIDIAYTLLRPGEEDPSDYTQLLNDETINIVRVFGNPMTGRIVKYNFTPSRAVFWYSPFGFSESDTFFFERAWANADIPPSPTPAPTPTNQTNLIDGLVNMSLGDHIYVQGNTTVENYAPTFPWPPGYTPLNNTAYNISYTGLASGPYTLTFRAQSVATLEGFNKLRVFQAEPDFFDPTKVVWIDKTVLPPNTPAPDFGNRTISAKSDFLGLFVVAKFENLLPSLGDADMAVTMSDSTDPVAGGTNNFSYTISVRNNGTQPASNVRLRDTLSGETRLISFTSSQGTCFKDDEEFDVYCSLGSIPVNGTATVTIAVRPNEGAGSFSANGTLAVNHAVVGADQIDPSFDNNLATETTKLLPDPNQAPSVKLVSPAPLTILPGPATLTLVANATDTNGTISRVEFFKDGDSLGNGVSSGNNTYSKTVNNVPFGKHIFNAIATDNGGRINVTESIPIMVNGLANVSVTNPATGAVVPPGSNLTLTATASHPSGTITKVEFIANGTVLGLGTVTTGNQYSFTWNNVPRNVHDVQAVATDNQDIKTYSERVRVTATAPPTVSITAPANNASFPSLTNVQVRVTAQDSDGSVDKVDIFANGALIGTTPLVGPGPFGVTWRNIPDGIYSIVAIARDNLGVTTTSTPVNITINRPSPAPGEIVWLDDALPPGSGAYVDRDVWQWVNSNPAPILGNGAHQSKIAAGQHQHNFDNDIRKWYDRLPACRGLG